MINKNIVNHELWGRCLVLDNGNMEIWATLDIGPRIIRYGYINENNMLFEDKNKLINNKLSNGKVWNIYGGHRVWISPETEEKTYSIDDKPLAFEDIENGVKITASVEDGVSVQKQLEIVFNEDSVTITNRIINKGLWPIDLSVWGLTVMAPGGKQIIPMEDEETGYLANRVMSVWPYTNLGDARVYWGDKYIALKQDDKMERAFKIGTNNEKKWAAYFNFNNLFIKTFEFNKNGIYPDNGVNYETYTNHLMMEMETLGELVKLDSNEFSETKENWYLFKENRVPENNDDNITEIMKDYINVVGQL